MAAERFIIHGDLATATFAPWVSRHLSRLGLAGQIGPSAPGRMELTVEGPPDLIDAMELGVSLGPIEAWVESVERHPLD
jgi:acylphosphatase